MPLPCAAHEPRAFGDQTLVVGEQGPPDSGRRRQFGHARPESLDDHPAVEARLLDRAENGGKIDLPGAGNAAVVLGHMQHADMPGNGGDRLGLALFLDMGVEGVVHDAEGGVPHALHIGPGLRHGVEEVCLEAVEGLEAQITALRCRLFCHAAMGFGPVAELVLRGAGAGEVPARSVEGAADRLCAERVGAFEDPVEMGQTPRAHRDVTAQRIGVRIGDDRRHGPPELQPVQLPA